jgi:large subunit ribosomal protein L13e
MKHNNVIPNGHFHKQWQRRVKTWFDQPGQKKARRIARAKKAAAAGPCPTELLRPVVRCPTIKYNMKVKAGRGFTFEELKAAGIPRKLALSVGIAVDHRRKNRSEESLAANKARLAEYKARLVVLTDKKLPFTTAKCADATETVKTIPIVKSKPVLQYVPASSVKSEVSVYAALRKQAGVARHFGIRAKRAAEKAEAAESKKSK